ncbi:MAG: NAD-dependent epimerase/dehydratase family protein [Crocinitomicaceae bacterium]|nr:NAD-dependent epimerase/dehydratase family protein [Crocinitomicaceae bacterium]
MNILKGKKVLITGGAGFIGSNLCEHFVRENEVICLDNLSNSFEENITHLKNLPNFSFIKGDIRDEELVNEILSDGMYVFHNAALGSVSRSVENPLNTNTHNIDGFLNVLNAARLNNVERFIYASSSSTYGDHPGLPKVEDKIGNPISPYAVTKLCNELYANTFHRSYGTPVIGLRYFNVFGKNQNPRGAYAAAIPRFVEAYINNSEITIFGDGEQTRDFTHIENVIQAIECAATSSNSDIFGNVFNIAFGSRISLNDLIALIKEAGEELGLKNSFEIKYGEPRVGDIRDSFASIEKAKSLLNYSPNISLKEGLRKLIALKISE